MKREFCGQKKKVVYFSEGCNLKWSKCPNAGDCLGDVNERRAMYGYFHSFVEVLQIFIVPDNILKTAHSELLHIQHSLSTDWLFRL